MTYRNIFQILYLWLCLFAFLFSKYITFIIWSSAAGAFHSQMLVLGTGFSFDAVALAFFVLFSCKNDKKSTASTAILIASAMGICRFRPTRRYEFPLRSPSRLHPHGYYDLPLNDFLKGTFRRRPATFPHASDAHDDHPQPWHDLFYFR